MAINVDLSKPLTDEQIENLRTRLPENLVQHYVALAQGSEFQGGETVQAADVPPPPPPKRGKAATDEGDGDK